MGWNCVTSIAEKLTACLWTRLLHCRMSAGRPTTIGARSSTIRTRSSFEKCFHSWAGETSCAWGSSGAETLCSHSCSGTSGRELCLPGILSTTPRTQTTRLGASCWYRLQSSRFARVATSWISCEARSHTSFSGRHSTGRTSLSTRSGRPSLPRTCRRVERSRSSRAKRVADMRQRVIVTGHKNPTDPSRVYTAVRGGDLNDETRFVLERFGFRVPPLLRSLMPQVQDIPRKRLVTVAPSTRVGKAAILMKENHIHSLPVVDDALVVRGVVDAVDIATAYADQLEHSDVLPYAVELDTLVRQLSARIVVHTSGSAELKGQLLVVTGSVGRLAPGSEDVTIIISDGIPSQGVLAACSAASTLIVTGTAAMAQTEAQWPSHLNLVLETDMTVTQALRALWSSIPVSAFMEGTVPLLSMTDTLERAKKAVLDSSARCAVVLDALHHPVNIVTRSDLIRFTRKKVVLVDHNETLQAVDGVEEADILEIIDHHRVGDISTFRPIYFH